MLKRISKSKRPPKVNELANYLVTESTREGAGPDKEMKEEISLLLADKARKPGKKSAKPKSKKR